MMIELTSADMPDTSAVSTTEAAPVFKDSTPVRTAAAGKRAAAAPGKRPAASKPRKTTTSGKAAQKAVSVQPAVASKPASAKVDKKTKEEKVKLVRDSFTIPKTEYAQLADMKKRAMGLGTDVKKSELIRAGLALLASTSDNAFKKALAQIPTLKTGRPGKA